MTSSPTIARFDQISRILLTSIASSNEAPEAYTCSKCITLVYIICGEMQLEERGIGKRLVYRIFEENFTKRNNEKSSEWLSVVNHPTADVGLTV